MKICSDSVLKHYLMKKAQFEKVPKRAKELKITPNIIYFLNPQNNIRKNPKTHKIHKKSTNPQISQKPTFQIHPDLDILHPLPQKNMTTG